MRKTVVINVVGLTSRLISGETPRIHSFLSSGGAATIEPVLPAVTCTAQATYLTGKLPSHHGIVGNGWYFEEESEVRFWRQSNRLVQGEKIWEVLRRQDPSFTCANLFWWYNMYSSADYSVTPRPNYLADGRKIPDIYTHPAPWRDVLQQQLGRFPLFDFWGPRTSVKSSEWIAEAALMTDREFGPDLTLIYLPHLDYNLQRYGTDPRKIGQDLREIDQVVGRLLDHYEDEGTRIILLSDYGITDVDRPVHLNRVLREAGLLALREERGLELLDPGASEAFAVADHQVAHIYVRQKQRLDEIRHLLEQTPGVERVLSGSSLDAAGLSHARSGDLIAVADSRSWFTYYFWMQDSKAPDYARTVEIHKKPGYDPVELFTDPSDPLVPLKVMGKLLAKKAGFRTVMDLIPLKAGLVRGSHGRIPESPADHPVFITNRPELLSSGACRATDVFDLLYNHIQNNPQK